MNKIILWDFDGTLGYRDGNWEEAIFEISADKLVKTKSNFNLISEKLQTGFPWHQFQKSFVAINNSNDWWEYVKPIFIDIFIALGFDTQEAVVRASMVPAQYASLEKWKLYNDTLPSLAQLQINNWKSVLVTNNIPEFPLIKAHLFPNHYFDAVFVSSLVGFNKPNPLILNGYLETIPKDAKVFVVGDREESDIMFAKAIHAKGIIVRNIRTSRGLSFADVAGLTQYLLKLNI